MLKKTDSSIKNSKQTPDKYVIPQKRTQSSGQNKAKTVSDKNDPKQGYTNKASTTAATATASQSTATVKYIPPSLRKKDAETDTAITFTAHGKLRQHQRKISTTSIQHLLEKGVKQQQEDRAATFINPATIGVVAKGGQIITVLGNKRNTKFDILNVSKRKEKRLIKQATFEKNDFAMCELAELYLNGELGNREVNRAYEWLLKAANMQNSHAMCLLAQLFESGDMGQPDLKQSQKWYERAAARNNKAALALLGQRCLDEYLTLNKSKDEKSKCEGNDIALLKKAMSYLERASKKGATRAIWTLANIYEKGLLGEKNIPKAIEFYIKAAKLGSPSSLFSLQELTVSGAMPAEQFEFILEEASLLIAGTSSDLAVQIAEQQISGKLGKKPERGIEMLKLAAKHRNIEAIQLLIKCYREGQGCIANLTLVQHWVNELEKLYIEATKQGKVSAILELAQLYLNKKLGKENFERAEYYFKLAAETGDVEAIVILAKCYITGKFGSKEPKKGAALVDEAIQLWTQRAQKNELDAILYLVEVYLDFELGFKDNTKASKWLREAVKLGHTQSINQLAKLHRLGIQYDLPRSAYAEDIRYLTLQAEKNNPHAIAALATMYNANIIEHEKDQTNKNPWAIKLEMVLKVEAETNSAAALFLGRLYCRGSILPRNMGEAVKWFLYATNLPMPSLKLEDELQYHLSLVLNSKTLSQIDKEQIIKTLLEITAKTEEKPPFKIGRILGDIYSHGNLMNPDYPKAIFWYEKAAKLENSTAMLSLGKLYKSNCMGVADNKKAIYWFKLSAIKGNEKAFEMMIQLNSAQDLKPEYRDLIEPCLKQFEQTKMKLLDTIDVQLSSKVRQKN